MQRKFYPEIPHFSKVDFQNPSESFRPVYVWQWQSDVTHEETDKQLAEMQRLGIKAICVVPLPKEFRPVAMGTAMTPDYLTPPYFEEYKYMADRAAALGMSMWLYDEGGWPSGGACGKVMGEHPDFGRRILATETVVDDEGTERTEYYSKNLAFERAGVADLPDCTREEAAAEFIRITHEAYKPYLQEHFGNSMTGVFTDEPTLARPVPYSEELKAEFEKWYGYSIEPYLWALLDDEGVRTLAHVEMQSTAPGKAAEKSLFELKVESNGPAEKGCMSRAVQARIDWFDMCSDLLCKNFLLQNKAWANAHDLSFMGHMDGDDKPLGYGCYYVMRALRCFDVPGVDVIWRQIFPAEKPTEWHPVTGVTCENKFFPRYASSAAAQIGIGRALTESFGVYGEAVTFEEMRYVLQFQAVRGINIFNLFGIPYGRRGRFMTGELPFFTEKHACYADLPAFNAFMERLAYVASIGYSNNRTALYIPVRDLWAGLSEHGDVFEALAAKLESMQIPFDIVDDDVLRDADGEALAKGCISMGKACYDTVILPPCVCMPEESRGILEAFAKQGGRLLISGISSIEDVVENKGSDKESVIAKMCADIAGARYVRDLATVLKAPLALTGETKWLRLAERIAENGKLFMIFNEGSQRAEFSVHTHEACVLLQPVDGKVVAPERDGEAISLVLESGDMACLWFAYADAENMQAGEENVQKEARREYKETEGLRKKTYTEESDATKKKKNQENQSESVSQTGFSYLQRQNVFTKEITLDGPFTLRRTKQFLVGEMEFILEPITEEAVEVTLGDWSETVGREFSGSCVYTTHFAKPGVQPAEIVGDIADTQSAETIENALPAEDTENTQHTEDMEYIELDLGEVRYTCEAFVNGNSLGVQVMAPYRFLLCKADLQEDNLLEIRVTNTAANAYQYTKSFEKWQPWQLGPYWNRQQIFREDYLSGGLIGPVKIRY